MYSPDVRSLTQWTEHGCHTLTNILQEIHISLRDYERLLMMWSFSTHNIFDSVWTTIKVTATTEIQKLTRRDTALSSRCRSWGLIGILTMALAHILSLVLIPHAVSHPLHPLSPRKPLQQKAKKYFPRRSTNLNVVRFS